MSIKLEHVVLASPEQMEFIIEGMRNPMNSWEKSDSKYNDLDEYKLGYADKDHKLDEWREFCKWIEELPYSELIAGKTKEN